MPRPGVPLPVVSNLLVPYTGATSGLDLGVHSLTASSIISTSLTSGYLPTVGTSGLIQNSVGTGFVKTTAGLVSYDNSTYLTAEADTLATVTTRGASAGATINVGAGNTLTLASSSITDSTGQISFDNENLSTTGVISAKNFSSTEYSVVGAGSTYAIDWNNGKEQYLAMNNGASSITFANPVGNSHYSLILKQPLSGASATLTWPTSASLLWVNKITPTLTTANSGIDVAFFIYSTALGKYIGSMANNLG